MADNKESENFISQVRRETHKNQHNFLEDIRSKIMDAAKLGKSAIIYEYVYTCNTSYNDSFETLKTEGFDVRFSSHLYDITYRNVRIEW